MIIKSSRYFNALQDNCSNIYFLPITAHYCSMKLFYWVLLSARLSDMRNKILSVQSILQLFIKI